MFFEKIYKRCSEKNEPLEYRLINEKVELSDDLVESLLRSGMADIKRSNEGEELYYNI